MSVAIKLTFPDGKTARLLSDNVTGEYLGVGCGQGVTLKMVKDELLKMAKDESLEMAKDELTKAAAFVDGIAQEWGNDFPARSDPHSNDGNYAKDGGWKNGGTFRPKQGC